MAINSIQGVQPLDALKGLRGMTSPDTEKDKEVSFQDILTDAMNKAANTEAADEQGMAALLAGEDVELHTSMIETTNASLALNLAIQVRNKVIESYNEVMRMQV